MMRLLSGVGLAAGALTVAVGPSGEACDAECEQAVASAVAWAVADAREFAASTGPALRTVFLDTDMPRADTAAGLPKEAALAVRGAAVRAASVAGMMAASGAEHPAWVACRAEPAGAACRAMAGTTRVYVVGAERVSPDAFRVRVGFSLVRGGAEDRIGWAEARGALLRVERQGAEWKVAAVEMRIAS